MRNVISLCLFVLLVLPFGSPLAGIINVPDDQATIQDGIDAALTGDTVLIANGTYSGDGNRDIDFGGKEIVVTSANGAEVTFVDCEGSYEDPHRGFVFDSGEGPGSILHGLTILHTFADTGSGLYINSASPTVEACVFQRFDTLTDGFGEWGYSTFGGGAACLNGSQATFIDCLFQFNLAQAGAGLYITGGSDVVVENCDFSYNFTHDVALANSTGAIYIKESSPTVTGCRFNGNEVHVINFEIYGSPGIYSLSSNPVITSCVFTANAPSNFYLYGASGAVFAGGTATVENCTFYHNYATGYPGYFGSCIFLNGADGFIRNNIFAFNEVLYGEQGPVIGWWAYNDTLHPVIECNDFYDNDDGPWMGDHAIYWNNFGNVSVDPRFCDTAAVDLHPDTLSICSPDVNECGVLFGALPVDPTCDLPCCTAFRGNINCDPLDAVDIADISTLIDNQFLTLTPLCCQEEADLDENGTIDVTDLSILIDSQFLTLRRLPACE